MKTQLRKMILLPLAAATLVAITGCQSTGDGDRTAGRVLDDFTITQKVQDALDDAPVYKFDDIHVTTYRGVVQLSGWAGSDDQKGMAEQLAQKVPGVQNVINNIAIKEIDESLTSGANDNRRNEAQGGTGRDSEP